MQRRFDGKRPVPIGSTLDTNVRFSEQRLKRDVFEPASTGKKLGGTFLDRIKVHSAAETLGLDPRSLLIGITTEGKARGTYHRRVFEVHSDRVGGNDQELIALNRAWEVVKSYLIRR